MHPRRLHLLLIVFISSAFLGSSSTLLAAIGKPAESNLRIVSYNIMQNRVWYDIGADGNYILDSNGNRMQRSRFNAFQRVLNGLDADIWVLQEMFNTAGMASTAMGDQFRDHVRNVTGQNDWIYSWDQNGRYLLTRYPILWEDEIFSRVQGTLIDLPEAISSKDILIINVHYKSREPADAVIAFVNDVRAGNHSSIPSDTSIVICGDFDVDPTNGRVRDTINNLGLTDLSPSHTGFNSKVTFGDVDFSGGNLVDVIGRTIDYFMYQSDVLTVEKSFIFNTTNMSQSDLNQYGLQQKDILVDADRNGHDFVNGRMNCDHFGIVVDFDAGGSGVVVEPTIPEVSFVSPPTTLAEGDDLQLTVDASDPDDIDFVSLYKNDIKLARNEGGAPYEWGLSGQNDPELENLQAGVYEFRAVAQDLSGDVGEATVSITVLAPGQEPPLNINFQPSSAAVPSGYLADTSQLYGDRGNGYSYGWASSFDLTRERNANDDQRLDTFNHTQANGDRVWEVGLVNGTYTVSLTGGDPNHDDSFIEFVAEAGTSDAVTVVSGSSSGVNFVSGSQTVTISDGRLTLSNGPNAANNKISYVNIVAVPDTDDPVVSFESPPSTILSGEDLQLTVNASDMSGIERVYLLKDDVGLNRSDNEAPFAWGASDPELQNLQAGVYVFRAVAEDPLGKQGEATISITVVDAEQLPPMNINFQPAASEVPTGYLADTSQLFADRGNGYSYGWASSFDLTRERGANADQRLDTFNHTQANGARVWEIELPNGDYSVSLTGGDPNHDDSIIEFVAEAGTANAITVASGDSTGINFVSGNATVTVADGRLTLSNGPNAVNNKISYVDIVSAAAQDPYEAWKMNNNITADLGDDDNDGLSNLMEFALGGNPNSAGSGQLPRISMNATNVQFQLQRQEPSVTYVIEKSTNLIDWTDYGTVTDTHGTAGNEATVSVPISQMNNGKLFLRLRVEK